MDDQELRARLERNEETFKGLMSLIPADDYYGKDSSDQWSRRKQSKLEKRAARKAKLAPGANKSALDVHNENDKKRKHVTAMYDDQHSALENEASGKAEVNTEKSSKKQKRSHKTVNSTGPLPSSTGKNMSKFEKRQAKQKTGSKSSGSKDRDGSASPKGRVPNQRESHDSDHHSADYSESKIMKDNNDSIANGFNHHAFQSEGAQHTATNVIKKRPFRHDGKETPEQNVSNYNSISFNNDELDSNPESEDAHAVDRSLSPGPIQNMDHRLDGSFKELGYSGGPNTSETPDIDKGFDSNTTSSGLLKLPKIDAATLQQRLTDRIAALREARKADGLDGKPARNRQELIEARRRKDELRKAHKKDMKAKARAASKNAVQDEVARLRGASSSPLESLLAPRGTPENHFSFGRVSFGDGTQANHNLTDVVGSKARKGPSDPKTALLSARAKQKRVSGLDESKRAKIESKGAWHSAEKKIAGEKLKDDTSLLKKTLKRNAQSKKKSENAWNERAEGIRKSQNERQKKREENLKNRKSAKGSRYGLQMRRDTGKQTPRKRRPGFEGTFKTSGPGVGK